MASSSGIKRFLTAENEKNVNVPQPAKIGRQQGGQAPNHADASSYPDQHLNKKVLRFQESWYKDFPWLHKKPGVEGVLCFYCASAHESVAGRLGTKPEKAFAVEGFANWKKAKTKFSAHAKSESHRLSVVQRTNASVDSALSSQAAQQKALATRALMKICSSIRYLLGQGLAIRGHESDDGNFQQLLQLRCEDVPELSTWLARKVNFTSWIVQNEIAGLFGKALVRKIVQPITGPFAVIVDGTQDVSGVEQESLSVRWTTPSFEVREDFVGMYSPDDTKGKTIADMICDVLLRLALPLDKLRGQTYDGASNMSGVNAGAQAFVKERQPLAIYIHCGGHSTDLSTSVSLRDSPFVTDCVQWCHELGVLFKRSSVMRRIFTAIAAEDDSSDSRILRPLCPTRWTVRTPAIDQAIISLKTVLTSLDELSAVADRDVRNKASGLRSQFEKTATLLGLKIALSALRPLESLNRALQSSTQTVSGMVAAAKAVVLELQSKRTDGTFSAIFNDAVALGTDLGLHEITLPRQRAPPRRFTGPAAAHQSVTPEAHYRIEYFKVIDTAVAELQRRFDSPGIKTYLKLETALLIGKAEDATADYPEVHSQSIDDDISRFSGFVGPFATVSEAVEKFKVLPPEVKALYPGVDALLRLLLVVPATSCTAERSFSKLRILKTWLRSTMSQQRLNHASVCYVHSELLRTIALSEIVNEFIAVHESRGCIFKTI